MIFSKKNIFLIASILVIALTTVIGTKLSRVHASQKPPLIPLRDFFRNPEKAWYKLSPDGTCLSFLASYQNRLNIFVQKIGTDCAERVTSVTDRDLREYFWKNNDLLVYLKDTQGDENFHLFGVSKDGLIFKDFTPFEGVCVRIIDQLEDDEDHILISTNKRDRKVFDVYRLNIQTGVLDLIAQNPGNIQHWRADHEGKLRVAVSLDGTNRSILYRDTESGPFRVIQSADFRDFIHPVLFTFDNKQLYVLSNINRDKLSCVVFDPVARQEREVMHEHADFDVDSVHFSRKRKALTDIEYISWKHEHFFLDPQTERMFNRLEQELKDCEIYIDAHSKNEDKFIVRTASDRSPGIYYLYDLTADTLTKLADFAPWLKEEYMAPTQPIQYMSRDGLVIHGYLRLPLGYEPKNLPVVVNPHGGPWMRDTWSFWPEFQFLANRGYAILQMNFRGSIGYGKKFWQSSFKQWGRAMQDDVTDGVKWLIDQGIADPKRIAIYGGSYGGYAALAGLAFTPDLYTCGIDHCGESNLFSWYESFPEYWKPFLEVSYEQIGHPEKDKELLAQVSPFFHVDNIKVPVLVVQGRMDPRVPIRESDQMVEALRKRGIEVEYMVKDNEGHGFNNEENKFDFYEAMEKFLARHLKAQNHKD